MEDIAYKIIRIPWNEIEYSTLEDFFSKPQIENDQLEFKSYDRNNKDINVIYRDLAKEICAFLNSEGGLLIWGAPVEDKQSKTYRGELTPIPDLDVDDVVRKITGKIVEMPSGIQVRKVQHAEKNLIIFQIPKSEYRPHQTDDRYFVRLQASRVPAPHHYVEALMKRVRYPDLRGSLQFTHFSYAKEKNGFNVGSVRVDIVVKIENNSPFQNEESPRFIIYCDHGTPIEGYEKWPPPEVPVISSLRHSVSSPLEIVHYGEKYERRYALGFDFDNPHSEGFQVIAILKFGGRYSPLKISHYEIDLSFFDSLRYVEDQKYEFPESFVKAKENALISDSDYDMDDLDLWQAIEN